ncbi:MAG: hypothetical protein R6V77_06085 [Candidatus Cloacimonadaceae bacterium]
MKPVALACLFLIFCTAAFTYSSYAETPAFTLDTVDPSLTLIAPNGGEDWYIGGTNNILWEALDTNFSAIPISLWYTMNGGLDYILIEENISNSGSYSWFMPTTESDHARVKIIVIDSFGNVNEKASSQYFNITYVPPAAPESLDVDISDNINAFLNWLPVTETIYGTPIIPDGYIVLYNETPYEDVQFYYFLARVYNTTYTHLDVSEFRDMMFYKVVAYKNYSRENLEYLDRLCDTKSRERILWKDVLEELKQGGE